MRNRRGTTLPCESGHRLSTAARCAVLMNHGRHARTRRGQLCESLNQRPGHPDRVALGIQQPRAGKQGTGAGAEIRNLKRIGTRQGLFLRRATPAATKEGATLRVTRRRFALNELAVAIATPGSIEIAARTKDEQGAGHAGGHRRPPASHRTREGRAALTPVVPCTTPSDETRRCAPPTDRLVNASDTRVCATAPVSRRHPPIHAP